jgi:glutaredoxin 3
VAKVVIYTKDACPYCVRAKNLFTSLRVPFEEINLEHEPEQRAALSRRYNWRTVPMILVGDRFLGGCDDTMELHRSGELARILSESSVSSAP